MPIENRERYSSALGRPRSRRSSERERERERERENELLYGREGWDCRGKYATD
jgi:hypothetical protein